MYGPCPTYRVDGTNIGETCKIRVVGPLSKPTSQKIPRQKSQMI